jgi:iron complex outermembrane receptor protein
MKAFEHPVSRFFALCLAGALTVPTAPAQNREAELDVAEVVVTARRREENLQEVPLSIAAFNVDDLASTGARSLTDIALLTPGLNFEAYGTGGYPVLTLRGLSATSITPFESNVSAFYGGVYIPRPYMVDSGLFGLERVEVVRGPQSALYGRNAFAGAVNYVPKTPPDSPFADVSVTAGMYDRRDYALTLGGAVLEGRLKAVAGYSDSEFDGTWTNAHPNRDAKVKGGTSGRMGGWERTSWFANVVFEPTDAWRLSLGVTANDQETEVQGRWNISRNTGQGNCSLVGGVLQFYCGELPVLESIVDPRSQGLTSDSKVYRAEVEYRFSDAWSADYLFGRVEADAFSYDQTSINSITGDSPAGVQFLGLPVGGIEGDSHEARLNFDSGDNRLSIGGFYSDLSDLYSVRLTFQPARGTNPITPATPGQIVVQNSRTDVETQAVFLQYNRKFLNSRLDATVEARYSEEKKRQTELASGVVFAETFTAFTPRVAIKYSLTEASEIYVSAAKGAKSGGFNGGNIRADERAFDQEVNWTYEIGSRNTLMDKRLLLNATAFFVDWSDLQTLSVSGNPAFLGTITRNVGSATSMGLEFEATARMTTALTAGLTLSVQEPKYGDNLVDPRYQLMRTATGVPIVICDGIVCPRDGSIGGNLLARQSQYQAAALIRYEGETTFWKGSRYFLAGDISYKSKQFVDPLLLAWVPDRTLLNASGGISAGPVSFEVFVRNLLDKKFVTASQYVLAGNTNVRYNGILGERRTAGVTLRYRFD